ncbi:hypothetical protein QTP88_028109 [Uroleucon formosanum]
MTYVSSYFMLSFCHGTAPCSLLKYCEKFRRISFADTVVFRPESCCRGSNNRSDFQSAFTISPVIVFSTSKPPCPSSLSSHYSEPPSPYLQSYAPSPQQQPHTLQYSTVPVTPQPFTSDRYTINDLLNDKQYQ